MYTIDTNGNTILYQHDIFGRLKRVFGPYDIGSSVATIQVEYDITSCPARTVTKNKGHHETNNTLDVLTYIDGLGRAVQVKKSAEVNGEAGMTVSGK